MYAQLLYLCKHVVLRKWAQVREHQAEVYSQSLREGLMYFTIVFVKILSFKYLILTEPNVTDDTNLFNGSIQSVWECEGFNKRSEFVIQSESFQLCVAKKATKCV